MHFFTLASLVAAATAAVLPLPGDIVFGSSDETNRTLVARTAEERNQCGDSLFIDKTTEGSPVESDCAELLFFLRAGQTTDGARVAEFVSMELPLSSQPYLVISRRGTCALGVRSAYQDGNRYFTNIGRDDVADLIQSSIERYARDNRVGAEGAMVCKPFDAGVAWAVFRG